MNNSAKFLDTIRLSYNQKNGEFEVPQPYIRIINKLISLKSNLIVRLPFQNESDYLIPVIYTLNQVLNLSDSSSLKITEYCIGDTLIHDNFVFKYQGIDSYDKTKVKLEFAGTLVEFIPIDRCPHFMKSNLVKLTPSGGFYKKLMGNQDNKLQMDTIISNQFSYKYTNLYFTVKNRAIEDLSSIRIDNKSIIDEFIIGNLVKDRVEILGARKKQGRSLIITVSNIEYLYMYIMKNIENIGIIFIEDEGFKLLNKNIAVLDMLLDSNVKIIIIADNITYVEDTIVKHKGFKVIEAEKIYQAINPKECSFNDFDVFLKNYKSMNVLPVIIENDTVNNLKKSLRDINKTVKEETGEVQDIYFKISSIFYRIADRISYLIGEEKKEAIDEYYGILEDLKLQKRFMNANVYKTLYSCVKSFIDITDSDDKKGSKYDEMSAILKKDAAFNSKIAIIYDRNQDLELIKRALIPFRSCNIELLTEDQYKYQNTNWDLCICTIYYAKTYEHVISKWNFTEIVVFLYDYQKKFLEIKSKKYEGKSFFTRGEMIETDNQSAFEEMLQDEQVEVISSERRYIEYAESNKDAFQMVEALPITFSNDYVTFYRENKKVFEVSSVIRGLSSAVSFKEAKDINVGDYIAVRESDKDIIRTAADKILEQQGKRGLRDTASQWKIPLFRLNEYGFDGVYEKLMSSGCTKDPMTIRNWIVNEDTIGPSSIDDLRILLNLDGNTNVDLIEVDEAIREIRGIHQKVGREISKNLSKYILHSKMKIGKNSIFTNELYIENIGNVKILRVNHIGSKMQVSVSETNKLHGGS